ncbi:STAS domain-containing protein [Streptomyces sp. NPDC046939]|uniref:STAS domain-containing protein n=1 Tax=Streptomyces sp. NPDC046939 TaxID=3155376 RepID=UPI0033D038CA
MSDLTLTTDESQSARVVVRADGELDLHTATDLYARLGGLLDRRPAVFLDLSRVSFCDSSGYNALLRLHRRALEAGSRFVLVSPHPTVSRLLALTASEGIFDVYDSQDEAFAAHPVADGG